LISKDDAKFSISEQEADAFLDLFACWLLSIFCCSGSCGAGLGSGLPSAQLISSRRGREAAKVHIHAAERSALQPLKPSPWAETRYVLIHSGFSDLLNQAWPGRWSGPLDRRFAQFTSSSGAIMAGGPALHS